MPSGLNLPVLGCNTLAATKALIPAKQQTDHPTNGRQAQGGGGGWSGKQNVGKCLDFFKAHTDCQKMAGGGRRQQLPGGFEYSYAANVQNKSNEDNLFSFTAKSASTFSKEAHHDRTCGAGRGCNQ